ncbi:MAG TPA: copper homeostasis protein CutC [Gemmatimonadales bacterium]
MCSSRRRSGRRGCQSRRDGTREICLILEACVDTLDAGWLVAQGGADRIELCANLEAGGVTPELDLLRAALARLAVPICPMIRPRAGNFVYDTAEIARMFADLGRVRTLGASGAVIGALTKQGEIERVVVARLRDAAGPEMRLTFHRAFDEVADQFTALETLIDLGIDRILTAGGAATAWDGRERLARLVERARGRIAIMAGGKVTPENAAELVAATGVRELHFRADGADKPRAIRARVAPPEQR